MAGGQALVALLRGINVGGIRIKMADLKALVDGLGWGPAQTFLQTGNVTLNAVGSLADVKASFEKALTERFHYEAFVHLLTRDAVARVAAAYPFERDDGHHAYLVFVSDPQAHAELAAQLPGFAEPLALGDQVIYWRVVKGETLGTPFAKLLGKAKYKATTTTRNLNTIEEILT